MKRVSSRSVATLTLVCTALLAPGWLLGPDTTAPGKDPYANWYGRAGGPVGADAISAVSRGASPAPASTQVQWYGRAGTPEGADAIEALSHVTPETLPPNAFEGWYGNAGGLQGSDRVTYLNASRAKVGVGYDKDVAERTNMQRHEVPSTTAGIAYDKDVVERTNLPRSQKSTPIQEAGVTNK